VKRSASSVVHVVEAHRLDSDKVVKRCGLITLSSNVQHISSINITCRHISVHFLNKNLDQFKVAVVGCKVKRCKLFICRLVRPYTECLLVGFVVYSLRKIKLAPMRINQFEAKWKVFKCTEGKRRVLPRLRHFYNVERQALVTQVTFQLIVIVLWDVLEDDLACHRLVFHGASGWKSLPWPPWPLRLSCLISYWLSVGGVVRFR